MWMQTLGVLVFALFLTACNLATDSVSDPSSQVEPTASIAVRSAIPAILATGFYEPNTHVVLNLNGSGSKGSDYDCALTLNRKVSEAGTYGAVNTLNGCGDQDIYFDSGVGYYQAMLTVTDANGKTATSQKLFQVGEPTTYSDRVTATITALSSVPSVTAAGYYAKDTILTLSAEGTGTYDSEVSCEMTITHKAYNATESTDVGTRSNCGSHQVLLDSAGVYTFNLVVTDARGLSANQVFYASVEDSNGYTTTPTALLSVLSSTPAADANGYYSVDSNVLFYASATGGTNLGFSCSTVVSYKMSVNDAYAELRTIDGCGQRNLLLDNGVGFYQLALSATDSNGQMGMTTKVLQVGAPGSYLTSPTATLTIPSSIPAITAGGYFSENTKLTLSVTGEGSYLSDVSSCALSISYRAYGETAYQEVATRDYCSDSMEYLLDSGAGDYWLSLLVTDANGQTDRTEKYIQVEDSAAYGENATASLTLASASPVITAGGWYAENTYLTFDTAGTGSYGSAVTCALELQYSPYDSPTYNTIDSTNLCGEKVFQLTQGAGEYFVRLTVTDANGETAQQEAFYKVGDEASYLTQPTAAITINSATPAVNATTGNYTENAILNVTFAGEGSFGTEVSCVTVLSRSPLTSATNYTQIASYPYCSGENITLEQGAGIYKLELTVTDGNSLTAQAREYLIVDAADVSALPALTADFTTTVSATNAYDIALDATSSMPGDSGDIRSYGWSIKKKNSTESGLDLVQTIVPTSSPVATVTVTSSGVYFFELTVTDESGATALASKTLDVGNTSPTLSPAFTVTLPSPATAPFNADVDASASTGTGITNYRWEVYASADLTTATYTLDSEVATAKLPILAAETYVVRLILTDSYGNTRQADQVILAN